MNNDKQDKIDPKNSTESKYPAKKVGFGSSVKSLAPTSEKMAHEKSSAKESDAVGDGENRFSATPKKPSLRSATSTTAKTSAAPPPPSAKLPPKPTFGKERASSLKKAPLPKLLDHPSDIKKSSSTVEVPAVKGEGVAEHVGFNNTATVKHDPILPSAGGKSQSPLLRPKLEKLEEVDPMFSAETSGSLNAILSTGDVLASIDGMLSEVDLKSALNHADEEMGGAGYNPSSSMQSAQVSPEFDFNFGAELITYDSVIPSEASVAGPLMIRNVEPAGHPFRTNNRPTNLGLGEANLFGVEPAPASQLPSREPSPLQAAQNNRSTNLNLGQINATLLNPVHHQVQSSPNQGGGGDFGAEPAPVSPVRGEPPLHASPMGKQLAPPSGPTPYSHHSRGPGGNVQNLRTDPDLQPVAFPAESQSNYLDEAVTVDMPRDSLENYNLQGQSLDAILTPRYESTNSDFEEQKTEISESPFASQKSPLLTNKENAKVTLEGLSSICMGEIFYLSPNNYTIGRSPRNEIVIKDRSLSREHAEIAVNVDGRAIIQDVGSSNGTYLNGYRISKADLRDGDQIKFGEAILRFTQVHPLENLGQRRILNELNQPIVIDELKQPPQKQMMDPLRIVVIAAIVASLMVVVMLSVFVIKLNNDNEIKRAKQEATELYLKGVDAMRDKDWSLAERQFEQARVLDPSVPGLAKQFLRIQAERVHSKTLEEARQELAAGNLEDAKAAAEKIPRDSIYYGDAHKLLLSFE